MRLYLEGKSEKGVGYVPDWLRVQYEQDYAIVELILDIQGEVDYKPNTLSCRVKGELVPWVLWNEGEEIDLSSRPEEEVDAFLPIERIAEIINNSETYEIGVYPVIHDIDDDETIELAEQDKLTECKACLLLNVNGQEFEKEFEFEAELNI